MQCVQPNIAVGEGRADVCFPDAGLRVGDLVDDAPTPTPAFNTFRAVDPDNGEILASELTTTDDATRRWSARCSTRSTARLRL